MKRIKNSRLFVVSLVLVIAFCFPIVFTEAESNGKVNGAEHRSAVAAFVQSLLNIANKDQGGIGDQVRVVANEQDASKDDIADAIDKVQTRSKVKTFLIGTDYKNIGQLRSDMVKTSNQIDQLKRLLNQTISVESKTVLQVQIQALEQEQQKINDFLKTNESKFSIFGWFVKLFNKNSSAVSYQNPMKGTWVHAREEDTGNNLVYINSVTYTPPPARFRHYFVFKENNICSSLQLAPDDRHYLKDVNCSLIVDGGKTFLNLDNEKYLVISQSESRLVLQKLAIVSPVPPVISAEGQLSCNKDSDCVCGVNIKTRNCFFGNKKYVDTTTQCPDFCSGFAGNLMIKCVNNLCKQVSVPLAE